MITPFLTTLNQLQVFHWQTENYAQHKALGKAYENLQNLFDTFMEIYYGKYGRPLKTHEYTINVVSYKSSDVIEITDKMFNTTLDSIDSFLIERDNDLINIRDEIEGEFNHVRYLLTLN